MSCEKFTHWMSAERSCGFADARTNGASPQLEVARLNDLLNSSKRL